jgi:hypothetical protein
MAAVRVGEDDRVFKAVVMGTLHLRPTALGPSCATLNLQCTPYALRRRGLLDLLDSLP